MPRLYHLVAVNERTGKRERLTTRPMDHQHAVTNKSKFNPHRDVRIQLEEVVPKNHQLASKFVAEEVRTGKYPRAQAVAIGLSRAKTAAKHDATRKTLRGLLKKYH